MRKKNTLCYCKRRVWWAILPNIIHSIHLDIVLWSHLFWGEGHSLCTFITSCCKPLTFRPCWIDQTKTLNTFACVWVTSDDGKAHTWSLQSNHDHLYYYLSECGLRSNKDILATRSLNYHYTVLLYRQLLGKAQSLIHYTVIWGKKLVYFAVNACLNHSMYPNQTILVR